MTHRSQGYQGGGGGSNGSESRQSAVTAWQRTAWTTPLVLARNLVRTGRLDVCGPVRLPMEALVTAQQLRYRGYLTCDVAERGLALQQPLTLTLTLHLPWDRPREWPPLQCPTVVLERPPISLICAGWANHHPELT